ncbi:hypothetical protein KDL29_03240 [bacterium]|nr:hypothetical protein [bacterium]
MLRLIYSLLALLLLFPTAARCQEEQLLSREQLLELYGDSTDELNETEANSLLLDLVNHEREQAGLPKLAPLDLAAFMARRHAADMARDGYSAHYDTDGHNPVERYNRLGGTDYVQENLILLEIDWPLRLTQRLVRSFHREWMASPEHRRTLLSPQATHFGSSFELYRVGGLYRMGAVQEFVCERGDYSRLPQRMSTGERLQLGGQFQQGVEPGYIGIGLQPTAVALSPAELNALPKFYFLPEESFQLPLDPQLIEQAMQLPAARASYDAQAHSFSLELDIPADWAGRTAYFYIFAQPPGDSELRCISCQTVSIDG